MSRAYAGSSRPRGTGWRSSARVSTTRSTDLDPSPSRNPDEALEETVEYVLSQIESALQRITDGTYGVCESCGGPISAERLAALPYAVRCVACAERR